MGFSKLARSLCLLGGLCAGTVANAQNPIQIENLKTGTTDWQLTNPALNHEIEGYASLTSVNRGGQIDLYVSASDPTYTIDIFRMGWYDGSGGREVMSTVTLPGIAQPSCPQDPNTGMTECQWTSPYVLSVPGDPNDPTNWASGVYLAKLTGEPSGKQSYIVFVVRDDTRPSEFLFAQNVSTYQAYNNWGGKSLYDYNSPDGRASKVSYNRPYAGGPQAGAGSGIGAGEFLTNYTPGGETYPAGWEYNAIRWLEQNGYDVTYATSVDLHEQPNLLLSHLAYLSIGHNEYWSMQMRTNVTNARDSGVSIGFFGADAIYWQIRFETSPVTGQADRTQVCYKSTSDPVSGPTQTIQWRELGLPESAVVGVYYQYDPVQGDIIVQNTSNWIFNGSGLKDGDHLVGLLGYEVDAFDPQSSPAGTILLGNSPYSESGVTAYSNMSVYTAASGATVFATGSIQWAWGLDDYNSTLLRPSFLSPAAQQITKNILSKFTTIGVQVSPTAVTLLPGVSEQFSAIVTGTRTTGVTWSMSPVLGTLSTSGLYTAPSTVISTLAVKITATSMADGTTSASATVTIEPDSTFTPILVNAGGASYIDSQGSVWSADTGFSGGSTANTTQSIANTSDPTLYRTERYGAFNYSFAVPNGSYAVTLEFAEIYYTTPGSRIFNVAINGTPVLTNFDIVAQAGAPFTALDRTFPVTVTGGSIVIQFTTGSADLPKISAIQIKPYTGVSVQVSPGTASLSGGQTQQFTAAVTGSSNTSVTWSMNSQVGTLSSAGLYTAPATITVQQSVTVTATSVADPTQSASAQITLNPPVGTFTPILVNAGGASYIDSQGSVWSADTGFSGGSTANTTQSIANTSDPTLYRTERYGAFNYSFAVPNGSYAVTLEFAEIYYTTPGSRIFNVAINGTPVLTNFDIVAQAGAPFTALDRTFPVTVTGGSIVIQFTTGSADLPKISAIQIKPYTGVSVQVSPGTASLSGGQTQQFTAAVTGSSNTSVTWSMNSQVGTLSSAGLYTAPATITVQQSVTVTATSVADPTQSASAQITLNPPVGTFTPILVNAGGASYIDSQGSVWSADTGFSGGSTANTTQSIANTSDPTLYRTERYGAFNYSFAVPNGSYAVTLEFAEIYYTTPGSRIFNVAINGTPVLTNFDIVAQAGAPFTALDRTFPVTVTGGSIVIQFTTGSADLPKISAIQIKPYTGVSVQVSPGTASLSGGQTQQFTAAVTGSSNTSVTWSMNSQVGTLSSAGLYTAPATITVQQSVTVTATSVADPTQSASAQITLNPPVGTFTPILVNAGGASYIDSQGSVWSADTGFSGGSTANTTQSIANTSDPTLYRTERYGAFNYSFAVPNGSYAVTLEFAEIYYTTPGSRIFNVAINGTPVLTNFDIVAQAGAPFTALDRTFPVTVTGGSIVIQFTTGSADLPKISAIEIH